MTELKYSKDYRVSFNADTHTYLLHGKILTGVTSLISRYKNKFDADAMAVSFGNKTGIEPEVLKNEWAEKAKASRENGTAVHKVFEDYVKTGEIEYTGKYQKEKVAAKFIRDMFESMRLVPVDAEFIVYNDAIASQIDLVARDKNQNHYILDWKTNNKIETNGFKKFMLPPFNNFPDASFYHYSLQLNIYKRLCKEYEIKDMFIVHIDEHNYKMLKPVTMNIPDEILYQQITQPAS